ncbi:MAG TPA: hypothetical protein DFR83_20075, partial [Deltaproteobacteria bacterium]|nr:hypothetical protein [Deltaproteobacteria bacterium]
DGDGDGDGAGCADSDLMSATGYAVSTGSTVGATDDHSSTLDEGMGANSGDVVYSWTAPSAGTYTFELVDSDFDTVLYIRDSACSSELAQNDDFYGLRSGLLLTVESGVTYSVVIDGYSYENDSGDSSPEEGNYVLSIYEGDMLIRDSGGHSDSGMWGPGGVAGAAVPLAVGIGLTLVIMAAGRRREDEADA